MKQNKKKGEAGKTAGNARKIKDVIATSHVQIDGTSFYDGDNFNFMFVPDDPIPGMVKRFRKYGTIQQMSDGTLDFVARSYSRSRAERILKLAHGCVSRTLDGAIQLTIKVFVAENLYIADVISKEAEEAVMAIKEEQLKN